MEAKKIKRKLILMQILSFVLTIAPLVIAVAFRWENYVKVPSDAIRLSVGGIIVVVILFFKAIGKLKMPQKRVVTYLVVLCLCYLLQNVLADATFLVAMATLGEVLDLVICQFYIKKLKEKYAAEVNADATTTKVKKEVKEMFDEYLGGGRS